MAEIVKMLKLAPELQAARRLAYCLCIAVPILVPAAAMIVAHQYRSRRSTLFPALNVLIGGVAYGYIWLAIEERARVGDIDEEWLPVLQALCASNYLVVAMPLLLVGYLTF